mgnify:CR=1 FL=1
MEGLVRFFNGIHMAVGITPLREDATPQQQRDFVLIWFGAILFTIIWCIGIAWWLASQG